MSIIALTHNNKNQYRRYPIKQGGGLKTVEGFVLADSVIVNCSITSTYGIHRIYVKQVFRKNNTVSITIASVFDDTALGAFTGDVTSDFTTLPLTPFIRFVSGSITLGPLINIQAINTVMNFKAENSELEESTIFCYRVPEVTSINDTSGNQLRGNVNFGNLTNLSKASTSNEVLFSIDDTQNIQNTVDRSSYLGNCPTPTIKTINGVYPITPTQDTSTENDGNIYLVGVKPIVFYGIPGQDAETLSPGSLKIDAENVTLNTLCTEKYKTIPPVDISGITTAAGINMYYNKTTLTRNTQTAAYPYVIPQRIPSNVYEAKLPEYYYWPQFVKREYYNKWRLQTPSAPIIISVTPTQNQAVVHFKAPENSGISSIVTYSYSLNNGQEWRTFSAVDTSTSFSVTWTLQPATDYYILLRANNSFLSTGSGEISEPFKFTTLAFD